VLLGMAGRASRPGCELMGDPGGWGIVAPCPCWPACGRLRAG